jgi:hypothetical protein
MTGAVFRSVAPDTVGGLAAPAEDKGGDDDEDEGGDDDEDEDGDGLDPHAVKARPATTATGTRNRRTAGRLLIAHQ